MKRIVNSVEMKALDQNTIKYHGIPSLVLMERAALSVVEELKEESNSFGGFDLSNVLVVCGSGNNGADGIAIARILHLAGKKVSVLQLGNSERMSEECKIQTSIAKSYDVTFVNNPKYSEYTTIVDAIFGVGLSRGVEGKYKEVIEKINVSSARVMAVDIPSGIDADNGKILGCAVKADATTTFAYAKVGQLLYPGKEYSGDLRIKDIGIYEPLVRDCLLIENEQGKDNKGSFYPHTSDRYYMEQEDLNLIPNRKKEGNKGTFGKVLIVAGSEGMAGAAILCAKAAMRCGAGMSKVITHESNRIILQQSIPEVMTGTYTDFDEAMNELEKGLAWADVIVCGCGLGVDSISESIVSYLIRNCRLPLVLDADALNIISEHIAWLDELTTECIITPHLGEMSRLCKKSIRDIKEDFIHTAVSFSDQYKICCVLKDAVTCTATPKGCVYLNTTGNNGMATAGSGDVLAGIIGGLLAVHTPIEFAGALGVNLHGLSGDNAKNIYGESYLMASDIIENLWKYLN